MVLTAPLRSRLLVDTAQVTSAVVVGRREDLIRAVRNLFERLKDGRSRTSGGTGLGLAIVKELIEPNQGRVAVEDSVEGARFVVTLPAD